MRFTNAILLTTLFGAFGLAAVPAKRGGEEPKGGDKGGDGEGGSGGGGGGSGGGAPAYQPCSSALYSQAQCCDLDLLGVVGVTCANPAETPENAEDFKAICAEGGQGAVCCTIPVAGLGVLCETPTGV